MSVRTTLLAATTAALVLQGGSALAQNDRGVWSQTAPAATARAAPTTVPVRVLFQLQRQLYPYWWDYYNSYYASSYSSHYPSYYSNYYYYSPYGGYGSGYQRYRHGYRGGSEQRVIILQERPPLEWIVVSPRYTPTRLPRTPR